jgi:hypothetical protein
MKHLWLRVGIVGLGALLGACGQDSNPAAPPGPSPSPSPASAGFLHALQGESIATYRIDGTTGQLQASVTQDLADARTLAGEPQGRFVYAARSPRSGWYVKESDPLPIGYIVALAPDPKTGALTAVSEVPSKPGWHNEFQASGGWVWLSATSTRVHALWEISTSHIRASLMTYAVGADGQLGPGAKSSATGTNAAVNASSGVLYWGDREYDDRPLRADTVEADGRLTVLGSSDLCGSSLLYGGVPLVAVNGWLLASGATQKFGPETVCSYEGPQLTPQADFGLSPRVTTAVAVVPRTVLPLAAELASGTPALVAMQFRASTGSEPSDVRLFRMDSDGSLHLLDTAKATGALLFHPSGRFLYLAGPTGLKVFAVRSQSQLQLVQELPGSEGPMAVTLAF